MTPATPRDHREPRATDTVAPDRWHGWTLATAGTSVVVYAALLLVSPGRQLGFPFGSGTTAKVAACGLVVVCTAWAWVALAMAKRNLGSHRDRWVLRAGSWSAAMILVAVVPTNAVMQVAFAAVEDWAAFAMHALALGSGLVWARAALVYQRRVQPGCERCGRTHEREAHDGWIHPPLWHRRVTLSAVLIPLLGFTVPHWLWAGGVPFGTVEVDELREVSGSLWVLGAVPAAGALLTWGLVRRWGQIVPGWVPVASGRPIPRFLAVIPGLLVAALTLQYGVMLTGCSSAVLLGVTDTCYEAGRQYLLANWAFTATYPVFLAWDATLGAAALGYHHLTRRRCSLCRLC